MEFKRIIFFFALISCALAISLKEFNYLMLCQVNKERKKRDLPYLAYSKQMACAAQFHSKYMASKKKMTHSQSSSSYSSPMKRIKAYGFKPSATAENVAYNQKNRDAVMKAWMNSSSHKKNILNKKYTHFGAGMKNLYWTQDFATSKSGRPKNVKKCPSY